MSKQEWKIVGGIAAIGLGLMLMIMTSGALVGGRMLVPHRGHAYYYHHSSALSSNGPAAEPAEPDSAAAAAAEAEATNQPYHSKVPYSHGMNGRLAGSSSAGGFFGLLFRLALIVLLVRMILGFIKKRNHQRQADEPADPGGARVVDDLENEIRVGDEIDQAAAAKTGAETAASEFPDPDEMTVDDLVRAMKRLGIKKLEL